ncbi:MAG: MmgE/PrpD family protein [archaeon]|nr:MmgE/PrpD family protein [archaeon]
MTLAEELGTFVSSFDLDAMDSATYSKITGHVKLRILDVIGIGLRCTTFSYAKALRDMVAGWSGVQESHVLGYGDAVPAHNAAFVNASLAHGIDYDDSHLVSAVHPSCITIPPAIAMGERKNLSGKGLIEAVAVGQEIAIRVAEASPKDLRSYFWHPTGICGTIGAAVVSAKILGQSSSRISNTIGLAGSMASGLAEWQAGKSWIKKLHPGWSSHAGIVAAEMSENGYKGALTILEGKFGFYKAHIGTGPYDVNNVKKQLGVDWHFLDSTIKLHPTGQYMQSMIQCAKFLKDNYVIDTNDIQEIVVDVHPGKTYIFEPQIEKLAPKSPYDAKFSGQYCIAAVLARDKVGLDEFTEEAVRDPAILDIAKKIRYRVNNEWPDYPKEFWPSRIVIKTNKERYDHYLHNSKGTKDNPATSQEVEDKYYSNTKGIISSEQARKIAGLIKRLEESNNISELVELITRTDINYQQIEYIED